MDDKIMRNLDGIKKNKNDCEAATLLWLTCTDTGNTGKIHTKRPHHHSFYEFHFILRGANRYVIDGEEVEIKENECIIIPPEKRHFPRKHSEGSIRFSVAFSISKKSVFADALKTDSCKVIRDKRFDEFVKYCLAQAEAPSVMSYQLIDHKLFETLCFVYKERLETINDTSLLTAYDIRVLKAKEFVQKTVNTYISCGDVAAHCGLSEQQLNRLFRRYQNSSLLSYIHSVKVDKAQELLTATDLSLKEISELLGFQNEYYFNTFFKRESGMTPGDYRKSFPNFSVKVNEKQHN